MHRLVVFVGLVALCGLVGTGHADELGASPRAAVREIEGLCAARRYEDVAQYLETPRRLVGTNNQLSHRLCDVLGRLRIDADTLSDDPNGDTDDDLANDRESIAMFVRPGGAEDPVLLSKQKGVPTWRISRASVSLVDTWYAMLPARYLVSRMPASLLRTTVFGLQRWQLFAIPLALLIMTVLGVGLSWVTRKIIVRVRGDEGSGEPRLARPIGFLWASIVGRALATPLGLPSDVAHPTAHVLNVCIWLAFFWSLAALVEGVRARLARAPWALTNPGSRALLQLASRSMKLVIFLCAIIGALAQVGLPVTSLLAGLGVGGLGLALAAQKTVENLFGAFSIGVDQPFREGDTITVDGISGTVEKIGLRSTRIRTAERTVVAIPNGKLADNKTENFTVRDRYRLATTLALSYATKAEQVRRIVEGVTQLVKAQPSVFSDVSVALTALGAASITVDVSATFVAKSFDEFLRMRQALLLGIMGVVEAEGASLMPPPQRFELLDPRVAKAPTS